MRLENERIIWQKDGIETTVALRNTDELAFVVDGKIDGSVVADRATQAGSGLIAALLHPEPRRAFVIGLGTGMTAGWLAAVPGMERVDVAELEPSIVEIARAVAPANQHVLSRPNVSLRFGDGREMLLTTKGQYDLIVSEPSNPYRAGVSALYTREFYAAVRARLREGGLFAQWVQGYEVDVDTLRTIIRTLRAAFGHLQAWQTEYGDVLFVASPKRRVIDVDRLRARLLTDPFRSGMPRTLLVEDAEGLIGRFVADDATLARVSEVPGIAVNTDDENTIDFAFARAVGSGAAGLPWQLLRLAGGARPETTGAVDWSRVAELRTRAWTVCHEPVPDLKWPSHAALHRARAVDLGCSSGRDGAALAEWEQQPDAPRDDVERLVVASGLAARGDDRALALADELESRGFAAEAWLVRARRAHHDPDVSAAFEKTAHALEGLRSDALPLCDTTHEVVALLDELVAHHPELADRAIGELLGRPFAAHNADESRRSLVESMGATRPGLCVTTLGNHLLEPTWMESALSRRFRCLVASGHPLAERARQDLVEFAEATAGSF
jgi:spermidine synthase